MTIEELTKLKEEKSNLILKLSNEHQILENKKQEVFNAMMELNGQLKLLDELIKNNEKEIVKE